MEARSKTCGHRMTQSGSGITEDLVDLGDLTVGRTVQEPGWRWSTHSRPIVGDWCQAHHVGVVLSGRFGAQLKDGTVLDLGRTMSTTSRLITTATIGDEPCVLLEWSGLGAFLGSRAGLHRRILTTLLFTDLVDSTVIAGQLGDGAWRELLSGHFELARAQIERFGGREVKTTGDGLGHLRRACTGAAMRRSNLPSGEPGGLHLRAACTSGRSSWSAPMSRRRSP